MSQFTAPAVGGRSEATAYQFLDTLTYVRVAGDETDGRQSVVEMHLRAGHAPPMHIHEDADETIHVIDGEVTAHTAETTHTVPAGNTVVLPRGEQHSLVADEQSVVLVTTTPAGFDEFVTAVGEQTDDETVPTAPPSEEVIGRVNSLASDHQIEIVGPPPVGPEE
jgi:quercetin dioxygenase-like cupin family protein